jgi:hypothetical protein
MSINNRPRCRELKTGYDRFGRKGENIGKEKNNYANFVLKRSYN